MLLRSISYSYPSHPLGELFLQSPGNDFERLLRDVSLPGHNLLPTCGLASKSATTRRVLLQPKLTAMTDHTRLVQPFTTVLERLARIQADPANLSRSQQLSRRAVHLVAYVVDVLQSHVFTTGRSCVLLQTSIN